MIPCILLFVLSISLLWKLKNAEKRRQTLLVNGSNESNKRFLIMSILINLKINNKIIFY